MEGIFLKKTTFTTFIVVLVFIIGGLISLIASNDAIITPHQLVSALQKKDIHLQKVNESADKLVLNHIPAAEYSVQSEQTSAQPETISIFTYTSAGALKDAIAELEQHKDTFSSAPVVYEYKNTLILHWNTASDSMNGIMEEALFDL